MSPYEILPHAADLKIKAVGETKEMVFSEMLRGVFESAGPKFDLIYGEAEKTVQNIEIKSANQVNMLVEFLNEALYLSDINNEAYFIADFRKFTDTELEAALYGQKIKKFNKEIKAATYHGAKIEEKDEKWVAVVLFDI